MERINNNAYRLDLPEEYGVSNTFNITNLIHFAGVANSYDEGSVDLRTNPLQEGGDDAILPRRGSITGTMARRLQEDWARDAGEGPRVLMNLRVDFLAHGPRLGPLIFVHIRLGFHYFWSLYLGLHSVGEYPSNVRFFSPCILGHLD